MKVLFGAYNGLLPALGLTNDAEEIILQNRQEQYAQVIEMIARGYINAGATLPTINGFFLRKLLHNKADDVYQKMLDINIKALLRALDGNTFSHMALCLGPMYDCYIPEKAPMAEEARFFHQHQYELCITVLKENKVHIDDIFILHETIGTGREAIGISKAAHNLQLPVVISFVVNKSGYLLSGENIEEVIKMIDSFASDYVKGFALNCSSPYAFERVIATFKDKSTIKRLVGFYPGPFEEDHSLYDSAEILYEIPKKESLNIIITIGKKYNLDFIGGCCGFSHDDIMFLAVHAGII